MTTRHNTSCPDTIFVLYGGTSCDGMGPAEYIGPTLDTAAAYKHWIECKNDPYSVGRVVVLTKKFEKTLIWQNDWDEYL